MFLHVEDLSERVLARFTLLIEYIKHITGHGYTAISRMTGVHHNSLRYHKISATAAASGIVQLQSRSPNMLDLFDDYYTFRREPTLRIAEEFLRLDRRKR